MSFKACKVCTTDRYPGCQDHCERYAEDKAKHEARKAAEATNRNLDYYSKEKSRRSRDAAAKKRKDIRGISTIIVR